MRLALGLARKGFGRTSPNPMVGAVLVQKGKIIGKGWHRRAGEAHAEIEAIASAKKQGQSAKGATLFVTLEPCCTYGRTPPCTEAIIQGGIKKVVVGATDPNPKHAGRGLAILKRAGIAVTPGVLEEECAALNEAFNHWIVHGTPFITLKAAMTLDGKIATVTGQSQWITGPPARAQGQRLRAGADAIAVGVNTIVADDPALTVRSPGFAGKPLRRLVLDPSGRTPLSARVVRDEFRHLTTVVVSNAASARKLKALREYVAVVVAPSRGGRLDLRWLARKLGGEGVTHLLVEGGGETNAAWLPQAHRVAFFYAPLVVGGRTAPKAIAGEGVPPSLGKLRLREVAWKRVGADLLLTARVAGPK